MPRRLQEDIGPHSARLLLGISLAAALSFGILAWFALRSGNAAIAAQHFVEHTLQVLHATAKVDSSILQAVSQQRLYVLLGDDELLVEVDRETAHSLAWVDELAALTADSPEQARRIGGLRRLIEQRVVSMRNVSREYGRRGHQGAVAELELEENRQVREALRRQLEEITDGENRQLAERLALQRQAIARARASYVGLAVAGSVLLLGLLYLQRRFRMAREAAFAATRANEAQLREIADGLPQLVYVTDGAGEVTLANRRWRDFTGLDPEMVRRGSEVSFVHPDDLGATLENWQQALATRQPYEQELRIRRHDGEWIWHLSRAVPMPDPVTSDTRWLGSMTDIHDRREADSRVRETATRIAELNRRIDARAQELADLNQELEAFSYSVSHDLRAPLRHVNGFTTLLQEHLAERLDGDDKGQRYMQTIRAAAGEMGQLIDDLLTFSRLGRQPMKRAAVELASVVGPVAEALTSAHPERRIDWQIGELPVVLGDAALLRIVFDNLLENAVKYTRPRDVACIVVEGEVAGAVTEIRVRDNGVGFDPRYATKLFGVFQRLHSEREFEGTGIGLATVWRILKRHGAEVRGESVLGQGATFRLTFPTR